MGHRLNALTASVHSHTLADAKGIRMTEFERQFGRPAEGAARAPGRVNLIGEHTDYNDGFVLPIAIERAATVHWARRDDRTLRVASAQVAGAVEADLAAELTPRAGSWSNYVIGVAKELADAGVTVVGADLLVDSDVPLGAGLSSSAAIEVAAALALMSAAGAPRAVDGRELALLCQRAENNFAGAPCGIMDQSIAVMAESGKAMLLDCRSGEMRHVAFDDPDLVLLVADTAVRHDIGDGGYPLRRRQCHEAADALGVSALRDVKVEQLAASGLGGDLLKRARHVGGEIDRTLSAVDALSAGEFGRFGELMVASHESLRTDFEVSCDELDAIVDAARNCDGVIGARMTGGGFGGCAIILAAADAADAVAAQITADFESRFHRRCPIFATRAAGGAKELDGA